MTNTLAWAGRELRWGSVATTTRSSVQPFLASNGIFLVVDPTSGNFVEGLVAGALYDGYSALAGSLAPGKPATAEQVKRIWNDAKHRVETELAEVTMIADEVAQPVSVRAALLVAIQGEKWLVHTVGLSMLHDGVPLTGDFIELAPRSDERFVLMTSGLAEVLPQSRLSMISDQLKRPQRAAAVIGSQIAPSEHGGEAAIVVDLLSDCGVQALEFPETLDPSALIDDAGLEDADEESGVQFHDMSADWAMRVLGIENPDDSSDVAQIAHGKRSATPPPSLDDFEFISYLGSGGFADVYLYEEQTPRRMVAIKVLKNPTGQEYDVDAFRAEIDLMAQLSGHPSIISVFDANIADTGQPYIVMQFCPLPSLAEQLATGSIDVADALRIGVQLAGAVHTAHMLGIVHHDLKPANVLTTEFGRAVLGDFGIASLVGASSVEVAGVSLPWAAPEVLKGERISALADVYSLAATIYTGLYGKAPFASAGSKSRREYIERVLTGTITCEPIANVPEEAMSHLRSALLQALARDPEERTSSAKEFGQALQNVQVFMGHPVTELEVPMV